jgi:hypothetical protein
MPRRIDRIASRVDPVSQTIKLFGEIRGDAPELMAGMSGRANIPRRNRHACDMRCVSSACVFENANASGVREIAADIRR